MPSSYLLCPLVALAADDLAEAKEEYLRTRKAAAKQLYNHYQKAIEDAKAKGLDEQANALDLEMRTFADREQEALKIAGKPSPFNLFWEINQTLTKADSTRQLSTEVQRRDAVQKALDTLARRINDKPLRRSS